MPGGPLNQNSTNLPRPWSPWESSSSRKIPTVEPGIEPGTSWLILRNSDHQTTRLVIQNIVREFKLEINCRTTPTKNNSRIKGETREKNIQLQKEYTKFRLQVKDRTSLQPLCNGSNVDRCRIQQSVASDERKSSTSNNTLTDQRHNNTTKSNLRIAA